MLFGEYGVDVVVTPESYTWDFGDGETVVTADPGRPYPAFVVTHTYLDLGRRTISLTTAWSGRYRLDMDPSGRWRDVEGTTHTVDQGEEFEVIELRGHLTGE
ncbi:PKD domain-containing protein [Cellulomonas palmilytica]|uniref:PKD domain-containing protein n=1 Tax=Cellulomonas palmilytica TaxID=2608402 RepID=UPI001F312E16|nr:PKD domain-containing protein [Cellulomonas palmilytica]UJP40099.1 PKD domain-containing protein [Cellulomonas palmilytica]